MELSSHICMVTDVFTEQTTPSILAIYTGDFLVQPYNYIANLYLDYSLQLCAGVIQN